VKNVNVDQRVANRIAAEAELEILKPFEGELVISRKQKEDLDKKIQSKTGAVSINKVPQNKTEPAKSEPKDVSDHSQVQEKKVTNWYSKGEESKTTFDWDKSLSKKPEPKEEEKAGEVSTVNPSIENKLDQLTESINKLVNTRFGLDEKKSDGVSTEMQELIKRLEKAEKENEENKRLIRSLQTQRDVAPAQNIFGSKIQIDKERKVDINHTEVKEEEEEEKQSGNIQITSVSKPVPIQKENPIISSTVSKDTLDSILEIHNKAPQSVGNIASQTSTKKTLSLDELISGGDMKIKQGLKEGGDSAPKTGTLVFPGINDEKKIDIKNINQKDAMRQTLLEDLEFLQKQTSKDTTIDEPKKPSSDAGGAGGNTVEVKTETKSDDVVATSTQSVTTSQFKDELMPKTKEDRMRALQDKIKSLNKGVSSGGKTNITASGLDPYRM
jgi:hypothetical protein